MSESSPIRAVSVEYGALATPYGRVYSVTQTVVRVSQDGIPLSREICELVRGITPNAANDSKE